MDGVERAQRCSCINIFIIAETKINYFFKYSFILLMLAVTCDDCKQTAGGSAATQTRAPNQPCFRKSLVSLWVSLMQISNSPLLAE